MTVCECVLIVLLGLFRLVDLLVSVGGGVSSGKQVEASGPPRTIRSCLVFLGIGCRGVDCVCGCEGVSWGDWYCFRCES